MSKIAPVVLVFGQSNAHAHGVPLPPDECGFPPLCRVLSLPRIPNQAFSPAPVVWAGYTSLGTNLGADAEETACLPTYLARMWEEEPELPPLYLICISIGAQGVTEKYMWYPDAPRRLIPGPHGTADISLFPLSCDVLRRAFGDLRARGLDPVVLGLHWLGGEEETGVPVEKLDVLPDIYHRLFAGWREAVGCPLPIYLYLIRSEERSAMIGEDPRSLGRINEVFRMLAEEDESVSVVDPRDCPFYDPGEPLVNGIYSPDGNHLAGWTQKWFAKIVLADAKRWLK